MSKSHRSLSTAEIATAEAIDDEVTIERAHFAMRINGVMVEIDGPADEAARLVAAVCKAASDAHG